MSYRFPLVELVWDDAQADPSWTDPKDMLPQPALVTTVGFLVKESDAYVVIASTYEDTDVVATMQIPKGMIVSRKVIIE